MRFDVLVLSAENLTKRIIVEAETEDDAVRQVEKQALQIVEMRRLRAARSRTGLRIKKFSLLMFSQELHALLQAGLTLMEALDGLIEKEPSGEARAVLQRLITLIREGRRFSDALTALPDAFPPLYVGLMKAAESTGDLPAVLSRYVEYQQRVDVVRGKIVSSSIYPAILLAVGGAVTAFLGGYVVPRFSSIYKDSGRELPMMSALLLKAGQFIAAHGTTLALGAALLLVALVATVRRLLRRGALSRGFAKLPGVGARVRLYEISRLYLSLGMLLESGIAVVQALSMSESVVSRDVMDKLQKARRGIESGSMFSTAFEAHELTTSISFRMIRVGERSGQLGNMLIQASNFYDGDIARFIDRFTRAFEPLLMLFIGVIVGGIVVLLYLPIFDLASSLQ